MTYDMIVVGREGAEGRVVFAVVRLLRVWW